MNETSIDMSATSGKSQTRVAPWRRWLLAFDAYNATSNLAFTSAIWVIYLAAHGYSPLAIGLFETLFHVAKFVAEIPTGVFADLLGRRKSLVVYCLIAIAENILLLMPTLPLLILSFTLSGVAFAFRGGADNALLWTLAGYADPERQEARYSKLVSRMFLISLVGEVVGTACGGYLGSILQILPFLCRAAMMVLAIVPLLFLPEQKAGPAQEKHATRPRPIQHFLQGVRAVWSSPALLGLLLISGLTEGCWQTVYFYYQLYLHGLGFALSSIGLIVAVSMGCNFLFTALAPWIMRLLPERRLVALCVGMQIAGLLLMSLPFSPLLSVFGYLVPFQAALAILGSAMSTYINVRSPEEQRATVLSFQTGVFSAAMIVLFPLFGLGVSNVSYSIVYLWTLIMLSVGSVAIGVLVWWLKKMRRSSAQAM
jgi:MFS family permease